MVGGFILVDLLCLFNLGFNLGFKQIRLLFDEPDFIRKLAEIVN